jgi:hypothetical protein
MLALWLLRYDLVWQSACQAGLPRYMAVCLIAGYFWLAVGGILWLLFAQFFSAGPRYDAMLHTLIRFCIFDGLCPCPHHTAHNNRPGIAVSKRFLSSHGFAASILAVANRR